MPISRSAAAPAASASIHAAQAAAPFDRYARIAQLQAQRRALLQERSGPRANSAELELRLAIIRAELHALYHAS
ncbi:MAG: hypothetical protein U7M05_12705 [Candidatus Igneacidithiobacillus chanchocoensis]